MDAMGNYPIQPKYEPVWNALEETGLVYGMHPFPAGNLKPPGYAEQYSGAELIQRTISTSACRTRSCRMSKTSRPKPPSGSPRC